MSEGHVYSLITSPRKLRPLYIPRRGHGAANQAEGRSKPILRGVGWAGRGVHTKTKSPLLQLRENPKPARLGANNETSNVNPRLEPQPQTKKKRKTSLFNSKTRTRSCEHRKTAADAEASSKNCQKTRKTRNGAWQIGKKKKKSCQSKLHN